ncbi:MAG: hypothetical protein O7D94_05650, partial [Planctomycetota bacterium]|nr:hypothetical protein [Planctomycetota bacterium]
MLGAGAAAQEPAAQGPAEQAEPSVQDVGHLERPDDPAVGPPAAPPAGPGPRGGPPTRGPYVSIQVNVDQFGNDIVGDAANEPSMAIDPNDPSRIAIGWRQFDTIVSNFRQAGRGYSTDGGASWTFPGVLEPGVFRSDPVLSFDADGRFYYNSLHLPFGAILCDVFASIDGGQTF